MKPLTKDQMMCKDHPGEVVFTAGAFKDKCSICVDEINFAFFGKRDYLDLKGLAEQKGTLK